MAYHATFGQNVTRRVFSPVGFLKVEGSELGLKELHLLVKTHLP